MTFSQTVFKTDSDCLSYTGDVDFGEVSSQLDIVQKLNCFDQIIIHGNISNAFNNIILKIRKLSVNGTISNSFNGSQFIIQDFNIVSTITQSSFNQSIFQCDCIRVDVKLVPSDKSLFGSSWDSENLDWNLSSIEESYIPNMSTETCSLPTSDLSSDNVSVPICSLPTLVSDSTNSSSNSLPTIRMVIPTTDEFDLADSSSPTIQPDIPTKGSSLPTIHPDISTSANSSFSTSSQNISGSLSHIQATCFNCHISGLNITTLKIRSKQVSLLCCDETCLSGLNIETSTFDLEGNGHIFDSILNSKKASIKGSFDNLFNNSYVNADFLFIQNTGRQTLCQSQLETCSFYLEGTGTLLSQSQLNGRLIEIIADQHTISVLDQSNVVSEKLTVEAQAGSINLSSAKVGYLYLETSDGDILIHSTVAANRAILKSKTGKIFNDSIIRIGDLLIEGCVQWGQRSTLHATQLVRKGDDQPCCLDHSVVRIGRLTHFNTFRPADCLISVGHFHPYGYQPSGAVVLSDVKYLDFRFKLMMISPYPGIELNNGYYLLLSLVSGCPRIIRRNEQTQKVWKCFQNTCCDQTPFRIILDMSFGDGQSMAGNFYPAIIHSLRKNQKLVYNGTVTHHDFIQNYPNIQRQINCLRGLIITGNTFNFGLLCPIDINRMAFLGENNQGLFYLGYARARNLFLGGHTSINTSQIITETIQSDNRLTLDRVDITAQNAVLKGKSISVNESVWYICSTDIQCECVLGLNDSVFFGDEMQVNSKSGDIFNNCYVEYQRTTVCVSDSCHSLNQTIWFGQYLNIQANNSIETSLIRVWKLILNGGISSSSVISEHAVLTVNNNGIDNSYINSRLLRIYTPLSISGNFRSRQGELVCQSNQAGLVGSIWEGITLVSGDSKLSSSILASLSVNLSGYVDQCILGFSHIKINGKLDVSQSVLESKTLFGGELSVTDSTIRVWDLNPKVLCDNENVGNVYFFHPENYRNDQTMSWWWCNDLYLIDPIPDNYLNIGSGLLVWPENIFYNQQNSSALANIDVEFSQLTLLD